MKIGVVSGSSRQDNPQSLKVAKYVEHFLTQAGNEVYLLDLAKANIKYWDETFWSNYDNFDSNWKEASIKLHGADALVIIAPEWNGMLPPALTNVFHLAIKGEFANKPALIISVSSGGNGVYPIAQLRLNCGKNSFINFIPQHVIIRNVNNVLNDFTKHASEDDRLTRERLDYSIKILEVYGEAFKQIRNSEIIKKTPFAYGM